MSNCNQQKAMQVNKAQTFIWTSDTYQIVLEPKLNQEIVSPCLRSCDAYTVSKNTRMNEQKQIHISTERMCADKTYGMEGKTKENSW